MNVNVNSTTRTELQPNFLSISFGPLPNKRYLAKKFFTLKLSEKFGLFEVLYTSKLSIYRKRRLIKIIDIPRISRLESMAANPRNPDYRNQKFQLFEIVGSP